jgi:hypothetical protein
VSKKRGALRVGGRLHFEFLDDFYVDADQLGQSIINRIDRISSAEIHHMILRVVLSVFKNHVSAIRNRIFYGTRMSLVDLFPQTYSVLGLPTGLSGMGLDTAPEFIAVTYFKASGIGSAFDPFGIEILGGEGFVSLNRLHGFLYNKSKLPCVLDVVHSTTPVKIS